jgi:NADH-quinone oxidoreductase subunit J
MVGVAADYVVFWALAPISVLSAVAMLLMRNAVHSALLLIVNLFTVAVFFLVLGSPFLFVVQIIVYAGAIMVLFLFVIMLLGVDREESLVERLRGQRPLALLLGAGLIAEVVVAVRLGVGISTRAAPNFEEVVNKGGNVRALSRVLFNSYFFPFEVTSVLLIVAAVAAMVMTRRHDVERRPGLAPGRDEEGRGQAPPHEEVPEPVA